MSVESWMKNVLRRRRAREKREAEQVWVASGRACGKKQIVEKVSLKLSFIIIHPAWCLHKYLCQLLTAEKGFPYALSIVSSQIEKKTLPVKLFSLRRTLYFRQRGEIVNRKNRGKSGKVSNDRIFSINLRLAASWMVSDCPRSVSARNVYIGERNHCQCSAHCRLIYSMFNRIDYELIEHILTTI